jgi:hypothetical protein
MSLKMWLMPALLCLAADVIAAPAGTTSAVSKPAATRSSVGTTIVGEQESAMGLYLTPWKEEYAAGADQPPSLLDAPLQPVEGSDLQREVEYQDSLSAYRRTHSQRNR